MAPEKQILHKQSIELSLENLAPLPVDSEINRSETELFARRALDGQIMTRIAFGAQQFDVLKIKDSYFLADGEYGLQYPLSQNQDEILIGRGNDSHIVLDDARVSRKHLSVGLNGDVLKITDTSTNGTEILYNQTEKLLNSVNSSEYKMKGQDRQFISKEQGLLGVFDGAGGGGGDGGLASETARRVVEGYNFMPDGDTKSELVDCLKLASAEISRNPEAGITTAVLVKIVEQDGKKIAYFASAGDSRFYVVSADGHAAMVTHDEGYKNGISNYLGHNKSDIEQTGSVQLLSGDRLILVSDGITGYKGDDLMSTEELSKIILRSKPGEESQNLVLKARKADDRTAVVATV